MTEKIEDFGQAFCYTFWSFRKKVLKNANDYRAVTKSDFKSPVFEVALLHGKKLMITDTCRKLIRTRGGGGGRKSVADCQ